VFWAVIPSDIIGQLGWNSSEELEAEMKGDKLVTN
jgi:antitoxin component of MazEF toxin-antitoxin module